MSRYALVTGASKGIGKSFAEALAAKGYNLLLVARSEEQLKELSHSISTQYRVKAAFLAVDLTEENAAEKVAEWCSSQTQELEVLINNAGFGLFGLFENLSLQEQLNILSLNINTVVALTHLLLPELKKQTQAYVLNIASTAAYQAVPGLGVYSASKAFVLSFSRALRYELRKSTVSVSCLCPGPTETGFASRAGLDALADLAEKFNASPEKVAKAGLKGMFARKAEIIPGALNVLSAFGATHLPKSLIERIGASLYKL